MISYRKSWLNIFALISLYIDLLVTETMDCPMEKEFADYDAEHIFCKDLSFTEE